MIDDYKGIKCPICDNPLDNGEDIVICPDCGAPYHRKCIASKGSCVYQDLHKECKSWKESKTECNEQSQSQENRRCCRCGTLNDASCIFCEVCGERLESNNNNWNNIDNTQQTNNVVYNLFKNPFGGVNPDDKIYDIPVKDWAIYIGQNTPYFIPKFKKMSDGEKTITFNFSSAIFGGFYYLYRKMYLWGIILLLIDLIVSLPSIFLQISIILSSINPETEFVKMFSNNNVIMIANLCSILNLVIMITTGFLTNVLYKIHCKKNINNLIKADLSRQEYVEKLNKKGGISRKIISILLIVYLVLSLISSFIIVSQYLR